jgi:hypothetical protein
MSNQQFLDMYGRPGRVGLACGMTLVDRAIARAERHIDQAKAWGQWSHAFLFSERRSDGHLWVIESDLQIHRKHIQLGVQENRCTKYHDEVLYRSLAVLDFGLADDHASRLLGEALDLLANHARYSLRELIGTLLALNRPALRKRNNVLAREQCFYCSAFVQFLFRRVGLDLTPGLDVKNTTPEDLARSPHPHTAYVLQREVPRSQVARVVQRLRHRVRARVRAARRRQRSPGRPA